MANITDITGIEVRNTNKMQQYLNNPINKNKPPGYNPELGMMSAIKEEEESKNYGESSIIDQINVSRIEGGGGVIMGPGGSSDYDQNFIYGGNYDNANNNSKYGGRKGGINTS